MNETSPLPSTRPGPVVARLSVPVVATSLCSLLLAALQSGRAVVYLWEFIRVSIRVSLRIFVKFLDFLRKNEILPLTWTQLWICVDLVAVKWSCSRYVVVPELASTLRFSRGKCRDSYERSHTWTETGLRCRTFMKPTYLLNSQCEIIRFLGPERAERCSSSAKFTVSWRDVAVCACALLDTVRTLVRIFSFITWFIFLSILYSGFSV